MNTENGFAVGLDIGTSKICAVALKKEEYGGNIPQMEACGIVPCSGLSRGIVVDMRNTANSIKEVVAVIRGKYGFEISSVFTGIGGKHLQRQNGIEGGSPDARDIITCVERAGLSIEGIIPQPVASGMAVLTDIEKDSGVILLDMGEGTVSTALFTGGSTINSHILTKNRSVGRKEIFSSIKPTVEQYKEQAKSGMVITGGMSLEKGLLEYAEDYFGLAARVGTICGIITRDGEDILGNPVYAGAAGLALCGLKQSKTEGALSIR